ncbi:hypothetical protein CNYM01_01674 [Colletotrichum nymphaeae SA-01]|uniref:Uncharacterized protein n=1 Tax=Colletotrichum nymphaeae SA-01 TaxID=1460502 RepID=A0A135TWZ5_9PEZI|nr:hypothetical protein CNYM01_01674 [Colletotrichum nymphaeae SA-01]
MTRHRPNRSTLTLVFKNHPSPGRGGKFRLIYDSERHCESQIRSLEWHKGVTAKANEREVNGRKYWQITVNGLNVQEIKSGRSRKGEREYYLTVLSQRAAHRVSRCLGLPDTRMVCDKNSGQCVVIVKSTFTEDELDRNAYDDVKRAQVSGPPRYPIPSRYPEPKKPKSPKHKKHRSRPNTLIQCLCS